MSRSSIPASAESDRRSSERFEVEWAVDCRGEDTFLYAEITNISQLGIFVACADPFEVGCHFSLRFSTTIGDEFCLPGRVQWVNRRGKNPGMGIAFVDLSREDRERIVAVIKTIAYVRTLVN